MLAVLGYGLKAGVVMVFALMILHGPGFAHPVLTAMMSRRVPGAQGELQGGISAITNVAMLAGTVFYSRWVFEAFQRRHRNGRGNRRTSAYWVAGFMVLTLALFVLLKRRGGPAGTV